MLVDPEPSEVSNTVAARPEIGSTAGGPPNESSPVLVANPHPILAKFVLLGAMVVLLLLTVWGICHHPPDPRNAPQILLAHNVPTNVQPLPELALWNTDLSAPEVLFGQNQVARMVRDRPEMARDVHETDLIGQVCVRAFVGAAIGEPILWDNRLPLTDGYDAEHEGPRDGKQGSIRIRKVSAAAMVRSHNNAGAGFTATEAAAFTTANVLLNDTDIDPGDSTNLMVSSLATALTFGSVSNIGNGTFRYDPNGRFTSLPLGATTNDLFNYVVTDGHGGYATGAITTTGLNNSPIANNDAISVGEHDGPVPLTPKLLLNDLDRVVIAFVNVFCFVTRAVEIGDIIRSWSRQLSGEKDGFPKTEVVNAMTEIVPKN